MRMRNDLLLALGLSVSLVGIATATEPVQSSPAVPQASEAAAPVQASAAAGVAAPAAPVAAAAPAAPAAAAATVAAVDENPMICKKITETGTLGRRKKLCMTAKQWEVQREAARGTMRRIDSGAGAAGPAGTPGSGSGG